MKIFKNLSPVTLLISLSAYGIAFVIWGLFLSMETLELKKCSKCKEEKPRSEFYINRTHKDNLVCQCKKCFTDLRAQVKNIYFSQDVLRNEMWKPIDGFEGIYEISNIGRVKTLAKNNRKEKIRLGYIRFGYLSICLSNNSTTRYFYIHRLVALAFILNPENKPQVNHINGDKLDNSVSNLEWTTQSENMLHAFKSGLNKCPDRRGDKNFTAKLTDKQVEEIIKLLPTKRNTEIMGIYGMKKGVISKIRQNKAWKHIPRENNG